MARVNVYLPDDLAARAKLAGVSISVVTQEALRSTLVAIDTDSWLDHLRQVPATEVAHDRVIAALDHAREDFGARPGS
jgi:post-segregation antitoxin (ccd killing protein)